MNNKNNNKEAKIETTERIFFDELTEGQREAMTAALAGESLFITGGAGVGKSYLTSRIVSVLQASGRKVLVTAPTGVAASLIGGATVHRTFDVPLYMSWCAKPHVSRNSAAYIADTVVIDEISMCRIDDFSYVIKAIRQAEKKRRRPMQIIVIGDFLQLPPVMKNPKDNSVSLRKILSTYYGIELDEGYSYLADAWSACNFRVINLTEVVRQKDEAEIEILSGIRMGDRSMLSRLRPASRPMPFPDDKPAIKLCGTNRTAEKFNREALNRLSGREFVYHSLVEGIVEEQDKPAPDELRLKEGARVMILINDSGGRFCNGDMGTVLDLDKISIDVILDSTGEVIRFFGNCWEIREYFVEMGRDRKPDLIQKVTGRFTQMPFKLAYAITIHKAQGQTLERAELILGDDPEIFAPGQLYVGLSRVKSLKDLYISGDPRKVDTLADGRTLAIYKEIEDLQQ